ncbi:uncharacterized protein EHS24_000800 [Apiotrichum porosum]|uniref:Uncharacterized protein n=1 Tax=Apiotrichum porosum TaxID=105984 RepID=A0A427YB17_9TREE|nr:uncharacterized protein EHS24_000800 [Apiotrichum porosum]RSH88266.1 hypothetical protein EHS24_000800 [Apiotrichum porosum]
MQRITRPTLNALKAAPIQSRGFAKATLIGRLGAVPEVRDSANGKKYVRYTIAVSRPPKRDENGEIVKGPDGFAVTDTDCSIESMPRIPTGSQLAVEAVLETRQTAEGVRDILLRDISHKVVNFKSKPQQ